MDIYTTFTFDAAHSLPNVPPGHKCSRVHGHTFKVEIHVSGPLDEHYGWVIDFADIQKAFAPLLEQLDHTNLNDIAGLENPTSENIALWIWEKLKPRLSLLTKVIVEENPGIGVIYRGE